MIVIWGHGGDWVVASLVHVRDSNTAYHMCHCGSAALRDPAQAGRVGKREGIVCDFPIAKLFMTSGHDEVWRGREPLYAQGRLRKAQFNTAAVPMPSPALAS